MSQATATRRRPSKPSVSIDFEGLIRFEPAYPDALHMVAQYEMKRRSSSELLLRLRLGCSLLLVVLVGLRFHSLFLVLLCVVTFTHVLLHLAVSDEAKKRKTRV